MKMKKNKHDDVNTLMSLVTISQKRANLYVSIWHHKLWDRLPKRLREILSVGCICFFDRLSLYFWGCSLILAAKLKSRFEKLFVPQRPHFLWAKFCLRGLRFSVCQLRYPRRTHGKNCGFRRQNGPSSTAKINVYFKDHLSMFKVHILTSYHISFLTPLNEIW